MYYVGALTGIYLHYRSIIWVQYNTDVSAVELWKVLCTEFESRDKNRRNASVCAVQRARPRLYITLFQFPVFSGNVQKQTPNIRGTRADFPTCTRTISFWYCGTRSRPRSRLALQLTFYCPTWLMSLFIKINWILLESSVDVKLCCYITDGDLYLWYFRNDCGSFTTD